MPEINKTVLFDIPAILAKINISSRQSVAELGCGNFGFFVFPLARIVGREGKIYAVDILKSTLEEITRTAKQENLPQITTVWSNLEIYKATKIETSSLDCALLVNILHQSDKRLEILRESVRLLKRGGKLLIIEWKDSDSPLGPSPEKRVNLTAIKLAAPKLNLEIKEEFSAGPYHFGLILNKI